MLKPAILFREELITKFQEKFYSEDMMYASGCLENWTPAIYDKPEEDCYQFAILNSKEELIGYVGFYIDWYASNAYNFGLISFVKGNVAVGKAMNEVMEMLINEYHIHRIEWKMIGGNPVERSYDRFLKKYNGTKHVFRDTIKDRQGKYHDSVLYEILLD